MEWHFTAENIYLVWNGKQMKPGGVANSQKNNVPLHKGLILPNYFPFSGEHLAYLCACLKFMFG